MSEESPTLLVEARLITKTFGPPAGGDRVHVLKDADLEIKEGETVAIAGPSGCGKSTLLNLIGALDKPDSGTLRVAGCEPSKLDEKEVAAYRNEIVGFVFQLHHLLPQCTVLENVLIPTLASNRARSSKGQLRAEQLLEAVGMSHRLQHRPGELSGGERQRVAVARALINEPKILLADEPTGALDRANAIKLVDLLVEINRTQSITVIMVTHAPELAQRMGRVIELVDGKFIPQ